MQKVVANAFTIPKESVMSKVRPPRLTLKTGHYWETIPIVNQKQAQLDRDSVFKLKKASI